MDDQRARRGDQQQTKLTQDGTTERPPKEEPADYEDPIDDASADSFPASDPPSFTDTSATRNPGDH